MSFLGSIGKSVGHFVQEVIHNPLQAATLVAAGPFAAVVGGKVESLAQNIIHPHHAPVPSQVQAQYQQPALYQPIAEQPTYQQPQGYSSFGGFQDPGINPYQYGGQQSWAYSTPSPVYSTPPQPTSSGQPDRSWETLAEGLTLFL